MLIFIFLATILGLIWGSFLNVAVGRLKNKKKSERTILGRSFCDSCKKQLSWIDMIPIVSYVCLRGRCRYCGKKIAIRHLCTELCIGMLAGLFGVYAWDFFIQGYEAVDILDIFPILQFCLIGFIFFLFTFLSAYDIWWQEIPIMPSIIGTLAGALFFILSIIDGDFSIFWLVSSALPVIIVFFINSIYKKQAFGAGDYFILAVMGLILRPAESFVAFECAILSGAFIGILYAFKIGHMKGAIIPLVPFLVFGWLVALNFGDSIVDLLFPSL